MSFDLGSQDLLKAIGCMVLSGPFLTGYTQVRRAPPRTHFRHFGVAATSQKLDPLSPFLPQLTRSCPLLQARILS